MIKHKNGVASLKPLSLIAGVILLVSACAVPPDPNASTPSAPIPPAKLYSGASVSGAWTPDLTVVNGVGVNNFVKGADVAQKTTITRNAGMVRFNDPWSSKEITVPLGHYDATDFGANGSITLQADVSGYPRAGGAYSVLSGFFVTNIPVGEGGGTREYVNMSSSCATSGGWTCSGSSCYSAPTCAPLQTGSKSSFFSRNDWEQHQIPSFGYATTNSFPRCDSGVTGWACPTGLNTLPTGDYYAKYILVSNSGSSVASLTANLNVTPIVKKDAVARNIASSDGALNVNVILVGSKNISDSHTAKGAQNLNLLFKETNSILKTNSNIAINQVKVYEWNDIDGGDYYSQVPYTNVGVMLSSGSQAVNSADSNNYVNIFMVQAITQSFDANSIILGISGGILGPPVNGTQTSGLVFSTRLGPSGSILGYNASCSVGACTRDQQDKDFIELGATVAHELGHYLGLNHPSETSTSSVSQQHDQLNDTPTCAPRAVGSSSYFDQMSCYIDSTIQPSPLAGTTCGTACDAAITSPRPGTAAKYYDAGALANLCPAVPECQFNHIMWYTTKNHMKVSGSWVDDGSIISPQSKALIQWNSFVR